MAVLRADWPVPGPCPCRLDIVGYGVGIRLLELGCFRDRAGRRDLHVLDALRFIHTPLWKSLFGHAARDLEQSNTVR